MPSLKSFKSRKGIKLLLVGPNGVGKSIAGLSFHKAGKLKLHEFDGRIKSLAEHYSDISDDAIEVVEYGAHNFRQFMNDVENLQDVADKYTTLMFDSVTTLTSTCVVFQLITKGKMSKTTTGGVQVAGYEEINGETAIVTKLLEICKSISEKHGTNIIWTAHPVDKIQGTGADAKRIASIASYGFKVPSLIPCYFDEIYYITKEKISIDKYKRIATTQFSNDFDVKSIYSRMPNVLDITDGLYDTMMRELNK